MNRGRPRLNICSQRILSAIRHHGKILSAAQELGCSDAYIHLRLKKLGISLRDILDAPDVAALLQRATRR
jgi:molybdenum-dependent DNA-binding transcriptional regulator ModE